MSEETPSRASVDDRRDRIEDLEPSRPPARSERARHLRRRRIASVVVHVVAIVLAIAFLLPLIWMVSASLKPESEILTSPLALIPDNPQPGNYLTAFTNISPFLWNSTKLAALNVAGVTVVASLAGFAFARIQFWGREVLFVVILATSIIPGIIYLLPQYILFQDFGWIDTHYPLWVPRVLTPIFGTFLMRQTFKTLPQELEDAGRIDGASTFTIFWRIMLPQTKPALAAIGVFTFVESWNDLFGPLIFINSTELQTLPMALALFQSEFFTTVSLLMAASTITILPVLILYVVAQRYFVEGITSSGLKG